MNHQKDIWIFANRIDLGPDYGTWITKEEFAEQIGAEGRKWFRDLADSFGPLEFIDANRRIER